MAELLTEDIIIEKLEADGFMQEPDGPWLLEHMEEQYGGNLDNASDWIDNRNTLKIYSESTSDMYDIYWCTHDERPYVSEDGYYYEDYQSWSERVIDELRSGGSVWIEPNLWSDMEYDFNYELERWWEELYMEYLDEKKEELLESGDYYEEEED